ncbi:MAG TPA: MarR family winged helix-turn-helix transcriptional regulator [Terracidiphilus sp.]|nr:MarR family winged helix-turn-helix transcriptional regulator [Terracidiphilus sp.]
MDKTVPASPLAAHLGYWMRFVSNHVSHAFRLKVEAYGVTVAEWVVLRQLLDESPTRPSLLAERLEMTRGAISKLLERLEAKRCVVRSSAEGDRRYQSVRLTPVGRRLIPALAALADANDAEFFGHLSSDERQALMRTLQEIVSHSALQGVPVD